MTLKTNEDTTKAKYCQFEQSMLLLKKKWTITLIRDMLVGKKYFSEFKENKPNLSNKVLSERLKELEDNGLIKKYVKEGNNTEYHLTKKGESLKNIIYELAIFNLNEMDYTPEDIEIIKQDLETLRD